MGFKIIDNFHSIKELREYDASTTAVFNLKQKSFIDFLGIDNILRFDDESQYFTNGNVALDMFLNDFDHYIFIDNSMIYELFSSEITYSSFENVVSEFLFQNRTKYKYDFIEGIFRERHSEIFISRDAPIELREAFYNDQITTNFLYEHKEFLDYLIGKDINIIHSSIPSDLVGAIQRVFGNTTTEGFEIILLYEKCIAQAKDSKNFSVSRRELYAVHSKDELLNRIDSEILEVINKDAMLYDESMPSHFKNNYPYLFVDKSLPKTLQDKFYHRELTLRDFHKNINLVDNFEGANIMYGFPKKVSFLVNLFGVEKTSNIDNMNRIKTIPSYTRLLDCSLAEVFQDFLKEFNYELDMDKIDCVADVLRRIATSNSSEIYAFRNSFARQLLKTEDPILSINKMEKVFLSNNLPLFGKMFKCFQILYPNLEKFDFSDNSIIAPQLRDSSIKNMGMNFLSDTEKRFLIIYNDMLREAVKSGNRDLFSYLDNIEKGNDLFLSIVNNSKKINLLSKEETQTLDTFISHLETLYQHTEKGKDYQGNETKLKKIEFLNQAFAPTSRHDLKDRIVRSFAYFAGYKSFDSIREDMIQTLKYADIRNRRMKDTLPDGLFQFEEGDYVRNIGDVKVLGSSLNIGNFSREHLGVFTSKSKSDKTPLDADFSYITKTDTIYSSIAESPTHVNSGNIFVFMKKGNSNLLLTRDKDGNLTKKPYDPSKIEMFRTADIDFFGVRTGFSFTDIDGILYKKKARINHNKPYDDIGNVNYKTVPEYDDLPIVKFEIAKNNGVYIPIFDFSGNLIFTEKEFDALREKKEGLSYYDTIAFPTKNYTFSPHLINERVEIIASKIDGSIEATKEKSEKIYKIMEPIFSLYGYKLKQNIDGDLTPGSIEIIDIGSTSRNTNEINAGNFDFLLRVDRELLQDDRKYDEFKTKILEGLSRNGISEVKTYKEDYRLKGVNIDKETCLDINISFVSKTNSITYSTDACLKDRLDTIKEQDFEKYKFIISNIILAKEVLKEADVYKQRRNDELQGGMGGVGIENWVLQNGGSFIDAATSFLKASEGKSFAEFKENYTVWDFGKSHLAEQREQYPHDNFIANNMNEIGYSKMVVALKEYVNTYQLSETEVIHKGKG